MELQIIEGNIKLVKREIPKKPSVELIPFFCNELNLSKDCIKKSREIAEDTLRKKGYSELGMTPRTFVASVIYVSSIMCKESRSQSQVASATETSEVSIKKGYQKIAEMLDV